jgi:aspartate carbamoyltransferase regulatory subunit
MGRAINDRFEVRAIENGTVIDHIPPDALFRIIDMLGLKNYSERMTFGQNLESKRLGHKAIIKLNDRYCHKDEINKIAIFAPRAVVNIIRNFEVAEKLAITPPEHIEGFVKCINPKCITNNEPVRSAFEVIDDGEEIALRCRYCEKITHREQFTL